MNWPRNLLICSALIAFAGCGVKGDPLPPDKPAYIGRGRPTYKRATEKLKVEPAKPAGTKQKTEEEEDDGE